jgi:ribosomal protein L7Ae-like RNA K-turn-binding protein
VPVIELSTKDELGRLTGKDSLGLLAVLDAQIAREIADSARWLAGLSEDG